MLNHICTYEMSKMRKTDLSRFFKEFQRFCQQLINQSATRSIPIIKLCKIIKKELRKSGNHLNCADFDNSSSPQIS